MKTYPITELNNVKIHGRTKMGPDFLPLFWNNSGVEVNCTGGELWIDLEVDSAFYEAWIATEINGAFMSRQMLHPGQCSICLYRSMTPGPVKNVKFYRELQAMGNMEKTILLVKGFRTDGDFLPVEDKPYKIEFIGDSITSGEGTYGATEDTEWLSMYMSSSMHYANIVGKKLNADIRIISQGGWGVLTGWDNNPSCNLPSVYDAICGPSIGDFNVKLGTQEPNDFASWKPDVIVVNLGTNDASAFRQPAFTDPETGENFEQRMNPDGTYVAEDLKRFTDAVKAFLAQLRKHNPDSFIVWVYGMLGYDLSVAIAGAVSDYQKETGDYRTDYITLPNTEPDAYGAHMHPGYASHVAAAKVLVRYLSEHLG